VLQSRRDALLLALLQSQQGGDLEAGRYLSFPQVGDIKPIWATFSTVQDFITLLFLLRAAECGYTCRAQTSVFNLAATSVIAEQL
jgi:hypothetical protein